MGTTQRQVGIDALDIVPIVVGDIDEALEFYTETLGFEVRTDEEFEIDGHDGRWVTIAVPGDGVQLSLTAVDEGYYDEATSTLLESRLGTQTWYTFTTTDCAASVTALEQAGVEITQDPETYPWGIEAMFADPFGNTFGLFEYAEE